MYLATKEMECSEKEVRSVLRPCCNVVVLEITLFTTWLLELV